MILLNLLSIDCKPYTIPFLLTSTDNFISHHSFSLFSRQTDLITVPQIHQACSLQNSAPGIFRTLFPQLYEWLVLSCLSVTFENVTTLKRPSLATQFNVAKLPITLQHFVIISKWLTTWIIFVSPQQNVSSTRARDLVCFVQTIRLPLEWKRNSVNSNSIKGDIMNLTEVNHSKSRVI